MEVELKIDREEFVAITGESGGGKSTLLRAIAGLEEFNGSIKVDGVIWQDREFKLPIQKREIGFVFQEYALFPNMSVLENLLYIRDDIEFAKYLLDGLSLYSLKDRGVLLLSGGERQRVAIARAFISKPKILLLDEPLSALNIDLRKKVQNFIFKLHKDLQTTAVMVTHSMSDIDSMSDRVICLSSGKIVEI